MDQIPKIVREAMSASGSVATCVPVAFDSGPEEAAFFVLLAGPTCKEDRRRLRGWSGPLSLSLDSDALRTDFGTVVVLRPEIDLGADQPFDCDVLLTPGAGSAHFQVLKLLATQSRLSWFFADGAYEVIRTQQHPLNQLQRTAFDDLLRDAAQHDAMVRMTSRYDAGAALSSALSRYARS